MRKKYLLILILIFLQILQIFSQSCGQTSFSTGLIVGGDETKRGEFPFLVALVLLRTNKFFCAANLITQKHALTASHCIHDKLSLEPFSAEDIGALLGKHNLKQLVEKGAVIRTIEEIILHKDWKSYTERYDADIAVLVFDKEVQLSEYIRTVCLPSSKLQASDLKEGVVAGWGFSERSDFTRAEDKMRKVNLKKPTTNEFCFLHESLLAKVSSNRTFCAGGDNSGPCTGDSGGGFYVKSNSVWELQGIVSSSLINQNRQCDASNYAVFTNIAHYIDWISEKTGITRKNEAKTVILKEIELDCGYSISNIPYTCTSRTEILTDDLIVKSVSGEHLEGNSNLNVKWLTLSGNVHHIPSGFGKLFPILNNFNAVNRKLTKLSKKNFENLHNLKNLYLEGNLIEEIDANTFEDLTSIEIIYLQYNELKNLSPNLLIHAQQLELFYIYNNLLEELDGDAIFRNNHKLQQALAQKNKFRKIKWNLSAFPKLDVVDLRENVCINEKYGYLGVTVDLLQLLQDKINNNCA